MPERDVIQATVVPADRGGLVEQLRALGVATGDVLVVHASMSTIGFVIGGAQTIVEALLAAVGSAGTITMPSHSGDWSEPSYWRNPPVPEAWWPHIRQHMPAFDPHLTPLRNMGAIAEAFHRLPTTRRSGHPTVSHLANGRQADEIVARHALSDGLGEHSPIATLYALDAKVLLLGVGHGNNTSLHLAEYRATWPGKARIQQGSPVLIDGERRWVTYDEIDADTDDFEHIGAAFTATGAERTGRVGLAMARLMSQRAIVDFATAWMSEHRGPPIQ